ncbi:hypothetical protein [Aeoliella mucimassa]|uniref:DUF998 domain-containing protein n=1 Tax=Aeoliella mucimassa TaxID=2527972 RepID=A0A518AJH2_9BACT|nr:hypothetical protein [Aeoliella mucimassa]QDU54887.1 hypothetical protein Pan181_10710 [Aeoliella mucimassa]
MSGARQGRRRRILQEEVLSASRELSALTSDENAETSEPTRGEGRRYALPEASVAGALAKHHFPSHLMAPVGGIVASVVTVAALAAMHVYQNPISSLLGDSIRSLIDAAQPTSLASWIATTAMLATAGFTAMVLAVRRHRVDDYRGHHGLWRSAIGLALLLSIDAATNLHHVLAQAAGHVTGMQLMSGNQGWWLAIGTVATGWVAFRVFSDIKESKLATAVLGVAAAAGMLAVIGPLAGLGGSSASVVGTLAQVGCYLLTATAIVSYMRFLRHDVVAGIVTKPHLTKTPELKIAKDSAEKTESAKSKSSSKSARKVETPVLAQVEEEEKDAPRRSSSKTKRPQAKAKAETAVSESRWTDGSDGYSDDYDEGGSPRKLSKSERKRLRQEKAARRAA